MPTKSGIRFSRREADKQLEEAWGRVLSQNGLIPSQAEARKRFEELNLSPNAPIGRGLTIGMTLALGGIGKRLARSVKTEADLEKALASIREVGEMMPTAIRKAAKELGHALPRRGGPGRQPKLSAVQAAQVCDQIAFFLRQGHTLKDALQKVAELTPTLLGKKVGSRTIQKAWDKRREYRSE